MATIVCVLDRDDWEANTDNMVVVDPDRKLLLWVPRDIWCPSFKDRINTAFRRGGHEMLRAALAEIGVKTEHSLCLSRKAVERALDGLSVLVPVAEPLELLYPLTPLTRVQDGRKVVRFRPPEERLEGERIHQWIGARRALSGKSGDLMRIRRQHVFVRCLLQTGFDFRRALADPAAARWSSPKALMELGAVRSDWRFATLDDVRPAFIQGKDVLLRQGTMMRWLAAARAYKAFANFWRRLRGWVLGRVLMIPSVGASQGTKKIRLLALLAERDEMAYLPGLLANVSPHVDGIVALDDGSTDGSGPFLESHPNVLEVLRIPADRAGWDEVGNFQKLHAAALRHQAEWIVALDADERLERDFRERAERVIRRGGRFGLKAFTVKLRELWNTPDTYRCDGIWGRKRMARLFAALPNHQFDYRPLHAVKAPLQARVAGQFVAADLEFFHLRTVRREDRESRRDRYKALDPEA
ncbi:MAG TPA: LCP family protein, partial [Candidatus Binatia bacterium]|nr:LCP family protein [Candidatus Binatia bacterium]